MCPQFDNEVSIYVFFCISGNKQIVDHAAKSSLIKFRAFDKCISTARFSSFGRTHTYILWGCSPVEIKDNMTKLLVVRVASQHIPNNYINLIFSTLC